MKILLTGGTGFIGSHVLKLLYDQNKFEIYAIARNEKKVNIFKDLKNVKFIISSLTDIETISKQIENIDILVHIALLWEDTPTLMAQNDTLTSIKLFEMAVKKNVKHIIYTSSTAVCDYARKVNHEEQMTKPDDFYGATKAATENYLHAFSKVYNIKATVIRPGYTFGNPILPGADIEVDNRFKNIVKNIKLNKDISLIKNDGTQFIDADDLAKIYLAVINEADKLSNFEIFYGLGKEFITWEYIARRAIEMYGKDKYNANLLLEDKGRSNEPNIFDVSKIERFFGFKFYSKDKIEKHLQYLFSNL